MCNCNVESAGVVVLSTMACSSRQRPANFIENIMQCLVFQCFVLVLIVQLYPASSAPEIVRPRGVAISSKCKLPRGASPTYVCGVSFN